MDTPDTPETFPSRYGPVFEHEADRDAYELWEECRRYEGEVSYWEERHARQAACTHEWIPGERTDTCRCGSWRASGG